MPNELPPLPPPPPKLLASIAGDWSPVVVIEPALVTETVPPDPALPPEALNETMPVALPPFPAWPPTDWAIRPGASPPVVRMLEPASVETDTDPALPLSPPEPPPPPNTPPLPPWPPAPPRL